MYVIEEIITALRKNTPYKFYFNAIPDPKKDSIAYEYYDISNDAVAHRSQLTLHIITSGINEQSLQRSEKIASKINSVLLTTADNSFSKKILSIKQNGGGSLVDENSKTAHKILYYDITERSR